MKMQKEILAMMMAGLMVSGAAMAGSTPNPTPGPSPINTNPGAGAGTQGAGGQVNFTGEITDTSCNVSTASKNSSVDLGKWAASYFSSRTESTQTPFSIAVTDCPASVTQVAVLFDGDKDGNDLKLIAGGDAATGVAVKLYESDRTKVVKLGTPSQNVPVTPGESGATGSATLNFYADYETDGATIKSGKANAVTNFLMVYN